MEESIKWLALGYNLPANPSKNRVYVWRKLKEFGAEYYRAGVAILPLSRQSMNQFRFLCEKIRAMDGEASLTQMVFIDKKDEQEMVERFRHQVLEELRSIKEECQNFSDKDGDEARKREFSQIKSMKQRLKKAQEKDFFGAGKTYEASDSLQNIVDALDKMADRMADCFDNTFGKYSR